MLTDLLPWLLSSKNCLLEMVSAMAKYFAYGSNLNVEDFDAWCERKGYRKGLLRFYATAQLPDYEVVFRHFSTSRRGGVLHIQPRVGQLVPGVLFDTDEEALAALDRKEGAPGVYERCQVLVINDVGMEESAISYRLCSEHDKGFVQPSSAYVELVRQGLANFGLPTGQLESAARNEISSCPDAFFFYGSLMRGEPKFPALIPFGIKCTLLAKLYGRLVSRGSFPGLVDIGNQESMVFGDFVRLERPEDAISMLDAIEGFLGFGKRGSLFKRTWVEVDVGDGRIRGAWAYRYFSTLNKAPTIASGDWRAHLGHRTAFLQRLTQLHISGRDTELALKVHTAHPFHSNDPDSRDAQLRVPLHESLIRGDLSERCLARASGNWTAY